MKFITKRNKSGKKRGGRIKIYRDDTRISNNLTVSSPPFSPLFCPMTIIYILSPKSPKKNIYYMRPYSKTLQ